MYELPSNFDPQKIVGKYLAKISFGRGSLHLDLDRAFAIGENDFMSIEIVGHYSYIVSGKSFEGNASEPLSGVSLVALLNNDVTKAKIIGRGDLLIEFGLNGQLYINEDNSGFESYSMHFPGEQEIIV